MVRARNSTSGVLAAMCLSLILVVASVSALNLALPELAVELNASMNQLTWIADAYTVALAALVLPIGALGDRIGRRRVLIAGNVVFGGASLAASFAETPEALIGWRVLMGLGAAMIMPGTLSTITAAFPPDKRSRGVAIWSGCAAAGAIIGLLVAGALLEAFSWDAIFMFSAATSVVAALAAVLFSPETRDDEPPRPDLAGALLTALAVGTFVFAVIEGNERGWTEPLVVGSLTVAAVSLALYAAVGLRTNEPLLDPRLFGIRGFHAGAVAVLVQFMAVFGFFFVGLQYLQLVLEYSPLQAALGMLPVAVVVMPISTLTPPLTEKWGLKIVMVTGLAALATGTGYLSTLDVDSGYWPFMAGLVICGVGIGITSSTGTAAIVGSLSAGQQGVASAMNDATREVGAAVGIALMGSVFGRFYDNGLPSVAHLPAEAAQAVKESPAAGLAVAGHLGPQGTALADAVRLAFMDGFGAALLAVSVILAVAAIGTSIVAPGRRAQRPELKAKGSAP